MRRRHWLLALLVLVGLWAFTQRPHDGALQTPSTGSTPAPAARPDPPPVPARTAPAPAPRGDALYPDFLPREAHAVLDAIARGGPYGHRQDGHVFQNRERRLPPQPRGYYREYTVPTPGSGSGSGSGDRGPRHIVTGGGVPGQSPPREYWYSDDHYRRFRRFDLGAGASR